MSQLLILAAAAAAAAPPQEIELSETIVVTGEAASSPQGSFETQHRIDTDAVADLDAESADAIIRRLPSVHVPVNSRGEAIAFMRSAGERQVAIFFEGASLNVPWDNRLDLSLIPAPLLGGGVRTAAGPLAPHYGVNALGAISLSAGEGYAARLATGSAGLAQLEGALPIGPVRLGGSWVQHRGDTLSNEVDLPFSQGSGSLRTNTDRRLGSVFAQAHTSFGAHDLNLTAFHIWGAKGIAPEGHIASGARFWRYPDIAHSLAVASLSSTLGPDTDLSSAAWFQDFSQTIDSYTSDDYETLDARQVDRDRTWGLRELLTHHMGAATFVGSVNFLHSTHRQRDISYDASEPPAILPDALAYSQRNWSVGGELEYAFSRALVGEIGIGYDTVDYLRTGDKPPIGDAQGWTGRIGAVFDAGNGWRLRAAAGRKIRAPTMRELFGQALNRFLINPDLRPERIMTAELGIEWRGESASFYAIPFLQDLEGTIDQRRFGSLRQRINLEGSSAQGVEWGGSWQLHPSFSLSGNATWTRVRRKDAAPGETNRIAEKPSLLARLRLDYTHPSGFSSSFEAERVGRAWSAGESGSLVPLERSTALNWRIAYGLDLPQNDSTAELFLHVDNLTDTIVEPLLGLPAPGRAIRIGVRIL